MQDQTDYDQLAADNSQLGEIYVPLDVADYPDLDVEHLLNSGIGDQRLDGIIQQQER